MPKLGKRIRSTKAKTNRQLTQIQKLFTKKIKQIKKI